MPWPRDLNCYQFNAAKNNSFVETQSSDHLASLMFLDPRLRGENGSYFFTENYRLSAYQGLGLL